MAVEVIGLILSWEQVVTSSGVLFQLVLVSGGSVDHNITVDGERAKSNITHLDSGVMYIACATVQIDLNSGTLIRGASGINTNLAHPVESRVRWQLREEGID